MDELKIFEHPMFGSLPVVVIGGKEYFGANEVANALEYKYPADAIRMHCDEEGSITYRVPTNGGKQQKKFITLGNVSRLIVAASKQSKNSEIQQNAKVYEKWIFDEVIPSVHKNGGYIATTEEDDDETILAKALLVAKKTIEKKKLENEQLKQQVIEVEHQVLQAANIIEQQKPLVLFATAVDTSESSILVGELAKLLKQNGVDIGQNRLFEWLRDKGYLGKKKGENFNLPTQKSMEFGLFEIKKRTINNPDGSVRVTRTPKVTGKGQIYFVNKLLKQRQEAN